MTTHEIVIDLVTLREGVLNISGYVTNVNSIRSIVAVSNGVKFQPESFDYPTRRNLFVKNFDFKIPVGNADLRISLLVNGKFARFHFRDTCHLSDFSHYFIKGNKIVYFDEDFHIVNFSYSRMIGLEINDLFKILFSQKRFFIHAIIFRLLFILFYPIMRHKKIWIIMDRKNMADDNAEHFFKYALNRNDDVTKFFAVDGRSDDFARLNYSYGNILRYGSFKHRFYHAFAQKIISSQGSDFYLNPFRSINPQFTAGLCEADFYFLQHGIIKDNMSTWLRKYDRNPKLIVTSTQMEYDSLFDEGYFYDEDVVQLLGLPRYDNLRNIDFKKEIIIMPSWRNYLTDERAFVNSEFYKRFNSLINNDRLIDYAIENNYQIVFKPHPELNRFLYLFDKNFYVKFGYNVKYQDIFNQSSLLITDYSSVFFDFAYLKKPVIYYQYGIDYHYNSENGYFNYKEMGFGDVFDSEDDVVDKIIEYIDADCEMEDMYQRRVDAFFKFKDGQNSRRCYDWIYEH